MSERPTPHDEAARMREQGSWTTLERRLGYRFVDWELLQQALRHGSAASAACAGSYQRLEFLGDAVLGYAVALLLFERFPHLDQGMLTRMRAHLTRSDTLATKSYELGLEQEAELGPSEDTRSGRTRKALLEDLFEALIGALALDGGWERAREFIASQYAEDIANLDERTLLLADPKTALQEAAQARGIELPRYEEHGTTGPDHKPRWVFEVVWDGQPLATGEGRTKRQAQQQAARRALARLGLIPDE